MRQRSTYIVVMMEIVFCVVVLVATIGFYLYIEHTKTNFHERNEAREKARKERESNEVLIQSFEETKDARASLKTRILNDSAVVGFIAELETIGAEGGGQFETKDLSTVPINTHFETLVIQVEIQGSYEEVFESIKRFEHLPYQSYVKAVSITRTNATDWTGTYEIRVTKYPKV